MPEVAGPPPLPSWSWNFPYVDMGNEGVMAVPRVAQGALTIPPQYDSVPRDYADKGLALVHSARQWVHGREWRV